MFTIAVIVETTLYLRAEDKIICHITAAVITVVIAHVKMSHQTKRCS